MRNLELRRTGRVLEVLGCGAVALSLSSCTSLQDESGALSALAEFAGQKAVVEGMIEYTGPASQWSGPKTFTLQVLAREGEKTQIRVSPDLNWEKKAASAVVWLDEADRKPAGALGLASSADAISPTSQYPVDFAREQLTQLAKEIETNSDSEQGSFTQCLYPVRVRLTRTDGTLIEKQGCRGAGGWEQKASEYTSQVIGVLASSRVKAPAVPAATPDLKKSEEIRTPASASDTSAHH